MRFGLIIVFLALSLGAGWWWWWTTTPQYSIEQAKDAIKNHDIAKFEKYVDLDTTSSKMVDDLLAKPMQEALGPSILGQVLITGIVKLVRPAIAAGVKHEIVTFVETGSFRGSQDSNQEKTSISLSNFDDHLGFRKHAFKEIAYSKVDGDNAQVELIMHNARFNVDIPLDISMRKMDGFWQVIKLSNFQSFCGKLIQLEATAPQVQSPVTTTN